MEVELFRRGMPDHRLLVWVVWVSLQGWGQSRWGLAALLLLLFLLELLLQLLRRQDRLEFWIPLIPYFKHAVIYLKLLKTIFFIHGAIRHLERWSHCSRQMERVGWGRIIKIWIPDLIVALIFLSAFPSDLLVSRQSCHSEPSSELIITIMCRWKLAQLSRCAQCAFQAL